MVFTSFAIIFSPYAVKYAFHRVPAPLFCAIYLIQQRFEFLQGCREFFHSRFKRRTRRQIHARLFQNRYGIFAATRRKECEIIFYCAFPFRQDAFYNGNCGNDTRCIFINVECVIEMRDSRPFVSDLRIVNDSLAVVVLVELIVYVVQSLFCERFARFRFCVRNLLEVRKLRLTEHRRANHIHIIIEQVFL